MEIAYTQSKGLNISDDGYYRLGNTDELLNKECMPRMLDDKINGYITHVSFLFIIRCCMKEANICFVIFP